MEDNTAELRNVPILNTGTIQLGDKPISMSFIVQHPQANQMNISDKNGKYKELFDELAAAGLDVGRLMAVFQSALSAFADAQNCYDTGNLDNSMAVACRTAVDSAIYEAFTRKKTDLKYTFEIKVEELSAVRWDEQFMHKVAESGLLSLAELEKIQYNIRDYGNFVAHLAEKRDEEFKPKKDYKWTADTKSKSSIKRDVSRAEATEVLSDTKNALALMIKNYFNIFKSPV